MWVALAAERAENECPCLWGWRSRGECVGSTWRREGAAGRADGGASQRVHFIVLIRLMREAAGVRVVAVGV